MDFHPHEYQKIAIQRIIDHTHYGLLLDMGLGKTVSTLIAIEQLMYDQFDIKKVLLIAPKKVAESTWTQEANKWNETSCLKIASVLGPEKDRIKALQSDSDIYVMNREAFLQTSSHSNRYTGTEYVNGCMGADVFVRWR